MTTPAPDEGLDLTPIKAREAKATPGPWFFKVQTVRRPENDGSVMIGAVAPGHQIRATPPGGSFPSSDGEFMANARQDIPVLVSALETAWAELDRLRAAVKEPDSEPECEFSADDLLCHTHDLECEHVVAAGWQGWMCPRTLIVFGRIPASTAPSPVSRLRAALVAPSPQEIEAVAKFAAQKSGQFTKQAFGDSRVEDAANVLEDVALMLRRLLAEGKR